MTWKDIMKWKEYWVKYVFFSHPIKYLWNSIYGYVYKVCRDFAIVSNAGMLHSISKTARCKVDKNNNLFIEFIRPNEKPEYNLIVSWAKEYRKNNSYIRKGCIAKPEKNDIILFLGTYGDIKCTTYSVFLTKRDIKEIKLLESKYIPKARSKSKLFADRGMGIINKYKYLPTPAQKFLGVKK